MHIPRALGLLLGPFIAVSLVATIGYSFAVPASERTSNTKLLLSDRELRAELVVEGIDFPAAMTFLGPNDILVLEKDKGIVRRIVDGDMVSEPLLDLKQPGVGESGLVGIAIANSEQNHKIGNDSARIFFSFLKP